MRKFAVAASHLYFVVQDNLNMIIHFNYLFYEIKKYITSCFVIFLKEAEFIHKNRHGFNSSQLITIIILILLKNSSYKCFTYKFNWLKLSGIFRKYSAQNLTLYCHHLQKWNPSPPFLTLNQHLVYYDDALNVCSLV